MLYQLRHFKFETSTPYEYYKVVLAPSLQSLTNSKTIESKVSFKQALPFKGSESNCSPTALLNPFWVELFIAPLKLWYHKDSVVIFANFSTVLYKDSEKS